MRYQLKNSEFHLSTAEELALIRGASTGRDRLLIELLVYTGMRRCELARIQRLEVDLKSHSIWIRRGKGGKQRMVFYPAQVTSRIHEFLQSHTSPYLFPGRGKGLMSLRNINLIVARVAARAGVRTPNPRYRNVGPHLLRHSFARNWKRAGGSLESLQKMLGHSSLKTTLDVYGTESLRDTEENYRKLMSALVSDASSSHF